MSTSDPLTPPKVLDTTTSDNYQYLSCRGSTKLTLQISNAAVYVGFGTRGEGTSGSAIYPGADEPFLPVMGSVSRPPFDEIRVKSYATSTPARVIIRAT